MRSSSELFKQGIMKAYTQQPNVSLNSDTIKDMTKYSKTVEGETKEATGASSAGAFSGPIFSNEEMKEGDKISKTHSKDKNIHYKKIEATEATGSGSVGSYETPAFLPKNSKNWRGGKKPIYKGGKFVEVKKKCLKFPYCNQGAGAIKIYENETLENVISSVSKKIGVEEQIIRRILYNNFKKKNKN